MATNPQFGINKPRILKLLLQSKINYSKDYSKKRHLFDN